MLNTILTEYELEENIIYNSSKYISKRVTYKEANQIIYIQLLYYTGKEKLIITIRCANSSNTHMVASNTASMYSFLVILLGMFLGVVLSSKYFTLSAANS